MRRPVPGHVDGECVRRRSLDLGREATGVACQQERRVSDGVAQSPSQHDFTNCRVRGKPAANGTTKHALTRPVGSQSGVGLFPRWKQENQRYQTMMAAKATASELAEVASSGVVWSRSRRNRCTAVLQRPRNHSCQHWTRSGKIQQYDIYRLRMHPLSLHSSATSSSPVPPGKLQLHHPLIRLCHSTHAISGTAAASKLTTSIYPNSRPS